MADLYPKLEEAIEGITRIDQTLMAEIAKSEEAQADLAPLNHVHSQLETSVAQIIDILEGPEVAQPFGQPAIRNDGLVDSVAALHRGQDDIKRTLGNGGIKVRLPWAVWVAIIGALGGLVVALIETLGHQPG